MQFHIAMLQLFQFSAAEKRTYTACYGCGSIGGCAFELVGAYLRFYLFEFLFGKFHLLFFMPLCSIYALQFGFLFFNDEVIAFQMFFASNIF